MDPVGPNALRALSASYNLFVVALVKFCMDPVGPDALRAIYSIRCSCGLFVYTLVWFCMDAMGPDVLKAISSCRFPILSLSMLSSNSVWTLWDLMLSERFLPGDFPVVS